MRLPDPRSATALAAALALAIPAAAFGAGPPGEPPPDHSKASASDGTLRSLTLITGDRVLFTESAGTVDVLAVQQPPEREGVGWVRSWDDSGVSVVPSDASPLVMAGRLDERLFHITNLVEQGLADDDHADLRLLLTDGEDESDDVGIFDTAALPSVAEVTTSLPDLGVQGLSIPRADAQDFWSELTARPATFTDSADTLWLDGRKQASLDVSAGLVGAPEAWESGFTGAGVRVAVLDTGYDTTHPDLADKVVAAESFVPGLTVQDGEGHGTHVASTIAGSGAASDGRYRGVAPEAELLIGKVLDDTGGGFDSEIIAGMEWAAESGAEVVNMSLGGPDSGGDDPLVDAVNSLSETHGALFVVAAGNSGGSETIDSPAVADAALAVGSTTKEDELSDFSSQGPRYGDFGLKPEIAAPGSDITAAGAEVLGEDYVSMSGTSMAAPHVAGAAVMVAQAHPEADGAELKSRLVGGAEPLSDISVHAQGAGRLDVERATAQQLHAEPSTLGIGRLEWPHDPAEPTIRTLTYHNPTQQDIELALEFDGPPGVISLSTETMEVPAQGSAEVEIRVAPGNEDLGDYTGHLVAVSDELRLVTPWSVQVSAEAYEIPIEATDSAGDPVELRISLQHHETGEIFSGWLFGSAQARLNAGDYRVVALAVRYADGLRAEENIAMAIDRFTVDADAVLRLSGPDSEPVDIGVDGVEGVAQDSAGVTLLSSLDTGSQIGLVGHASPGGTRVIPSTTPVPGLEYHYEAFWAVPWASVTVLGEDGFTLLRTSERSNEGHDLHTEGTLVDITHVAPDDIGDMTGMIPLIADIAREFDDEHILALVESAARQGAETVLSPNYVADLSILPVVQMYTPEAHRLLYRLEEGPADLAVTLTSRSPVAIHLADSVFDVLDPEEIDWRFSTDELAELETVHHSPIGSSADWGSAVSYRTESGMDGVVVAKRRTPHRRTEYYSPDVEWATYTLLGLFPAMQTVYERFAVGPNPQHGFWVGPLGPSLPNSRSTYDEDTVPPVFRQDDVLDVQVSMFGDSDPRNIAFPTEVDTGSTVLSQDGTEIGRSDAAGLGSFELPASADGWFELSTTGKRSAEWWPISTEVRADWRFHSGPGEAGAMATPRLLDVRYGLDLDEMNSATADEPVEGTVTAAAHPDAAAEPVTEFGLEYSLDDGDTWQNAVTQQSGDAWTVEIPATAADQQVSLRATASDASGHSVTETIIKAYSVR
ncbi:S8 family peptidase [Actinoalloteichus hymeniacidonis]|uniref:Subtilisin-like serine protease n=1 Tax=Actinoalloteichus hymeniacidonis TaxID=340345 RepID=A0AAC9MZT2_9PSEU|nr:S8 family serine peptidase [Actinoalloteichus hymeniacidonis]AOS64261.1 subtilisin-like serine protease [Actinoalloteichus hymeniacidonis]MBB5907671.1 subtilisin family serine protease [Actinoalloteichus hymeniacidonis]